MKTLIIVALILALVVAGMGMMVDSGKGETNTFHSFGQCVSVAGAGNTASQVAGCAIQAVGLGQ